MALAADPRYPGRLDTFGLRPCLYLRDGGDFGSEEVQEALDAWPRARNKRQNQMTMERTTLGASQQVAWLAAWLTIIRLTVACEAAPRLGRAGDLSISIVRIGRAASEAEAQQSGIAYFVHPREFLVIQVSAPLPPQVRLYPLVRREGEVAWNVQPYAIGPGGRNIPGEWTAHVALGRPTDTGVQYELQVIAATEPLSPTLLSDDMKAKSSLAASAVIQVERYMGKPSVGIAAILASARVSEDSAPPDPQYVYGDEELVVHEESLVELVARDLPTGTQVGVAVRPAGIDERWVMPDFSDGQKTILAHFGEGDGSERSFHYTVSAFVAMGDALPPAGRGIPSLEWQKYQAQFLAESRVVRVVRWQRDIRIEKIGGIPVQPGRILLIDQQVNVHGAAKRRLQLGERVWIVCVPLRGNPWIAGSTPQLSPSGHWAIKVVRLRKDAKPEPFDILAVVSADDATKVRPEAVRNWLNDIEGEDASTRVSVSATGVLAEIPVPADRRSP